MANILLVTASTTHAGVPRSKAALESGGHVVTLITDTALGSASLVGVDVIAVVRATRTTVAPWLSARWAEGFPILLGGTEAGAGTSDTAHTGEDLGILSVAQTRSNSTAYAQDVLVSLAAHPITAGFTAGGSVTVLAGANWSVIDESAALFGTLLGEKGGVSPGAYFLAVDAGDTIAGSATAPARAVFCGWLYAGQTDYTADGKTLLGQAADWLTADSLPSSTDVTLAATAQAATASFTLDATAPPLGDYEQEVLTDSPLLFWRLDDTTGPAVDTSGNARTGAVVGSPAFGAPSVITDGTAVTLAAADRVERAAEAALGTAEFTYEAWVRTTHAGSTGYLVYRGGTDSRFIAVSSSGTVLYRSGSLRSATTVVNDGQPHHLAITQDATTVRLYVDGTLAASSSQAATTAADAVLQAGGSLDGTIDEVAVYGSALSAAAVQRHYDAGLQAVDNHLTLAGVAPTATASFTLDVPADVGAAEVTLAGVASPAIARFTLALPNLEEATTDRVNRVNGRNRVMRCAVEVEPPVVEPTRTRGHDYAVAATTPPPTLVDGRPT